jgi:polyphosphate kinase
LDEFFRVRFAAIRRLSLAGESGEKVLGGITSKKLLTEITDIVIKQQSESLRILNIIEKELEKEGIYIINETQIAPEQEGFVHDFFIQKVSPALVTIILNDLAEFPLLKDTSGYLAVKLVMKTSNDDAQSSSFFGLKKPKKDVRYAVIEIPNSINRFVVLP